MKTLFALFILPMIVLNRCKETDRDSLQVSPMSVISVVISDTVQLGQPIAFAATCSTPTPCWEFMRVDISQTGRQYNITVFAKYDGRPCIQMIGSFKASSSVMPKERGTYTLRFWRSKAPLLDTTVVVQ